MVKASVCFPYRSDNGGRRDELANWISTRWDAIFPNYYQVRGESEYLLPFNRSQAINEAAHQAVGDYLIIADLDTIFHKEHVEQALEMAKEPDSWGYAFRSYFNLTYECSKFCLAQNPAVELPLGVMSFGTWGNENVSGVMVLSKRSFEKIGGFDENFVGWGFEDAAFDKTARKLSEPFRVEQGYLLHLWHNSSDVYETTERNRMYFEHEYGDA